VNYQYKNTETSMISFSLFFLIPMTKYKQYTYENKGKRNACNDPQTHPYRTIHIVIMNINNRAQSKSDKQENNTSNKFPFPGNQEYQKKYERGYKMHDKTLYLFPNR